MKLYRIGSEEHLGSNFGYFTPNLEGTSRPVGRPCPLGSDCPLGTVNRRRRRPARLNYVGGPVGDFMDAIDFLVARREVAEELALSFTEIRPSPIVVNGPKRGEAVRYKGPEMLELRLAFVVPYNPGISSLRMRSCCTGCRRVSYEVEGMELRPREVKIDDRWVMVDREPRQPGQGVIVFEQDLDGRDFFTFGDWLQLCTERAKRFIEERGWTNVSFIEYGEVVAEDWVPHWSATLPDR